MEPAGTAEAIAALTQQMTALAQAVQDLQASNTVLLQREQRRAQSVPLPDSPPATGHALTAFPEPAIPMPDKFTGKKSELRSFITACELLFALKPRTYPNDYVKVRTTIALLSGQPQTWAHQLLHSNSPILDTWDSFAAAMRTLYDDPLRPSAARSALRSLRQGRRPVEDYTTDFRELASDTGYNETGLIEQYRLGLSEALKDELARVGVPTSLEDLILLVTQLDRRFRERRSERQAPAYLRSLDPPGPVASASPSSSSSEEPMQIGMVRRPLTEEERKRRRSQGLCLYCGKADHQLRSCPVRPTTSPGKGSLAPSSWTSTVPSTSSYLSVSLSLQWGSRDLQITAIIDSGASGCFIDQTLVRSHHLPMQLKSRPLSLFVVDGTPIKTGPVLHETGPICLLLGHHKETINLDIVPSPIFPLILGLPWLRTHNPMIDWIKGTLTFSSTFCTTTCLKETPKHLLTMNLDSPVTLPDKYKEFQDVFNKQNADQLPPSRPYDCPIDLLPGAPIPYGRVFPLSETELTHLKEYITDSLAKGFIRPSTSPAGAGIFFVGKKDGGLRPCIDYRALNNITIKNRYPLPLIPELLDRLKKAKIFSKLDLRGAYNLVRIRKGDEWKTAFRTRYGHFEYLVMPFGLCNAPATFQHFLNDVFRDILDSFVVIYLDDILIFSSSSAEHNEHMRRVLLRLREHRLYAKLEKCVFDTESVEFLGYLISPGKIQMDPSKITAILEWPIPKDKKSVQRFIGFANFYRRFIRGFSQVCSPITALTKNHDRFTWTSQAQEAFEKLKELFTQAPILIQPNSTKAFLRMMPPILPSGVSCPKEERGMIDFTPWHSTHGNSCPLKETTMWAKGNFLLSKTL